jgi:hypothetical protein
MAERHHNAITDQKAHKSSILEADPHTLIENVTLFRHSNPEYCFKTGDGLPLKIMLDSICLHIYSQI